MINLAGRHARAGRLGDALQDAAKVAKLLETEEKPNAQVSTFRSVSEFYFHVKTFSNNSLQLCIPMNFFFPMNEIIQPNFWEYSFEMAAQLISNR